MRYSLDATDGAVERRTSMNKVVEFIPEDDLLPETESNVAV